MRILHTADWHLGKLFYGNYLTEDQAYVLEQQFLPLLRDEGIDASSWLAMSTTAACRRQRLSNSLMISQRR